MATATDYRNKSETELQEELLNLRKEQFNLRMQQGAGQVSKPHLFTSVRRDIARIKTILAEKSKAGNAS
jgi:large subunit ribosomal protein L29